MKQGLGVSILQKQSQKMSAQQIQYLDFIMMNQANLDQTIQEVFESNPTLEVEDGYEGERSLIFDDVLNTYVKHNTLKEDLYLQLLGNPNVDYEIMAYLIESLDEFGFIPTPNRRLADELHVTCECIAYHRCALQQFEPVGIGSLSVKDNINTQLKQYEDSVSELSIKILNEFLSKNVYDESLILEYFDVNKSELDAALNRIHECIPTFEMNLERNERAFPDVIIQIDHNEIMCETTRNYEKLKINNEYRNSDDDQVKQWYRESEQLIEKIKFRNSTLLNVLQIIIEHQKDFFLKQNPLNPLTLSDIANVLNVNTSTVSRAISGKTALFNQEIYHLSEFFIATTKHGDSADAIKKRILAIVKNEEKVNSDQKIVDILRDEGFQVERRTVAKYRKDLKIPSSSERRRIRKWD